MEKPTKSNFGLNGVWTIFDLTRIRHITYSKMYTKYSLVPFILLWQNLASNPYKVICEAKTS